VTWPTPLGDIFGLRKAQVPDGSFSTDLARLAPGEISGLSPAPLPRVVTRQASPVVCGGLRDFRAPALQEAALTIIKRRLPRVATNQAVLSRRRRLHVVIVMARRINATAGEHTAPYYHEW
jgi:hypothetical protein